MATQKLQAITQFLQSRDYIKANKLNSWSEDPKVLSATKNNGNSLTISRHEYTAVISIEHYSGSAEQLMADISTWLLDNDKERWNNDLDDPTIEIDQPTGSIQSRVDVELFIPFLEEVNIVPDPNGDISFRGDTWRLETQAEPLWVAEEFELTAEIDGVSGAVGEAEEHF